MGFPQNDKSFGRGARRVRARLFDPVPSASIAFFRAAFGFILAADVLRLMARGDIAEIYTGPEFHFTYLGFGWVQPWNEPWLTVHFLAVALCAGLLGLGLFYRWSASLFFVGFTYIFLLEKGRYLNHFYLVIVLAFLLAVIPAHRAFSLDAYRRSSSRIPLPTPAWALFLLRFQIGLVYLYAGIAKLNPDWLRGQPLRQWLPVRGDYFLVGPLLELEFTAYLFSYGGLCLDLVAWPGLAFAKTRRLTFGWLLGFHLANAILFGIGIFPWLMIAATTVFFAPDWPIQLWRSWFPPPRRSSPDLGPSKMEAALPSHAKPSPTWVLVFVSVFVAIQVLVPLRHVLYPGTVHWTEEGHGFSWHMMLRTKRGEAAFLVRDLETEETWLIDPRAELKTWQYQRMVGRPDMILQYAHHLGERFRFEGHPDLEVKATVEVSLNGRPKQTLVDPNVNLLLQSRNLRPRSWVLPLDSGL